MSDFGRKLDALSQQLEEILLLMNSQEKNKQVPEGWGAPSNDLAIAQSQYVDAAWNAESISQSFSTIVGDWRNVLVKPKAVDALFMAAHAVIKRVAFDLESIGGLSSRSAELVRCYVSATVAQDVALTELVEISSKIIQRGVESNDPAITNVASNLLVANLIDLVAHPVDNDSKTA